MFYPNLNAVIVDYKTRAAFLKTKPWIVKAERAAPSRSEFSGLLQRLENLLRPMSAEHRKAVKARFDQIIPEKAIAWREEYDEQFREVIVELLGWKWLQEKYPGKRVGFYPRSTKKGVRTPDLGVWNGTDLLVAAMECKKFNVSEEERDWLVSKVGTIKSGTTADTPNHDPTSPLAKKLVTTIQAAKGQLDSTHLQDSKFIFMSVSLDTPYWIDTHKGSVQQFVQQQASTLGTEGVELITFEGYQPDQPFV